MPASLALTTAPAASSTPMPRETKAWPYFSIVSTPFAPALLWPIEAISCTLSLKSLPKAALMFFAPSAIWSKPMPVCCVAV